MGTRVCANKKNSKGNDRSLHSKGPRRRNSAEHRRGMRTRSAIPTACRPPDSPEHREFAARCRASRRMPTSPWMGSCVEESGYLLKEDRGEGCSVQENMFCVECAFQRHVLRVRVASFRAAVR
jgi:hypothetical protein